MINSFGYLFCIYNRFPRKISSTKICSPACSWLPVFKFSSGFLLGQFFHGLNELWSTTFLCCKVCVLVGQFAPPPPLLDEGTYWIVISPQHCCVVSLQTTMQAFSIEKIILDQALFIYNYFASTMLGCLPQRSNWFFFAKTMQAFISKNVLIEQVTCLYIFFYNFSSFYVSTIKVFLAIILFFFLCFAESEH